MELFPKDVANLRSYSDWPGGLKHILEPFQRMIDGQSKQSEKNERFVSLSGNPPRVQKPRIIPADLKEDVLKRFPELREIEKKEPQKPPAVEQPQRAMEAPVRNYVNRAVPQEEEPVVQAPGEQVEDEVQIEDQEPSQIDIPAEPKASEQVMQKQASNVSQVAEKPVQKANVPAEPVEDVVNVEPEAPVKEPTVNEKQPEPPRPPAGGGGGKPPSRNIFCKIL